MKYKSDISCMVEQKIAIYLKNMISYLKFFMRYPGFWNNQIYKPSYINHRNK